MSEVINFYRPKMQTSYLKHDCQKCVGLCCVAPQINTPDGKGVFKDMYTPCKQLTDESKCAIFDQLKPQKRTVCSKYTCLSAGNIVTKYCEKYGINLKNNKNLNIKDYKTMSIEDMQVFLANRIFNVLFECLVNLSSESFSNAEEIYTKLDKCTEMYIILAFGRDLYAIINTYEERLQSILREGRL